MSRKRRPTRRRPRTRLQQRRAASSAANLVWWYAVLFHDLHVRLITETGAMRHLDQAGRIHSDATAPQARGALHMENLDNTVVPERQELQRREQAGTEIWGMRDDLDAKLVGKGSDFPEFGNAAD